MKIIWLRAKNIARMEQALNRIAKRTALLGSPMPQGKKWVVWLKTEDKNMKSGEID